MPVEEFNKYMGLSRVLNNSWGTGSQAKPGTSQSIKFTLQDDKLLKGLFVMIVNMPNNPLTAREMRERYKGQALQMLKAALEKVKDDYEEQNQGKTISLKMVKQSMTEGLEYLTNAQYRPTHQAYYRLQCLIEID